MDADAQLRFFLCFFKRLFVSTAAKGEGGEVKEVVGDTCRQVTDDQWSLFPPPGGS